MVHLTNISITFLWIRSVIFLVKVVSELKFGHLFFRASFDLNNLRGQIENPKILFRILMWKKGKILVWFEMKVSILIIWGTRLSFKLSY